MKCCIYRIYHNKIKNLNYIGSTKRELRKRISEHKCQSSFKKNLLYVAIRKFGFEMFSFEVLEMCKESDRYIKENYYIKKYDSFYNGLNESFASQGAVGRVKTKKEIKSSLKTLREKMPFFKITNKENTSLSLITNSYCMAAKYTGYARDTVRKKIKNNIKCDRFTYKYIN